MLEKHLLEGLRQVRIRLFPGIANPVSVKLPTPMSSYPFTVGSAVRRPEYRTVFGDVDGPQTPFIARSRKPIVHRQFVLAPSAEAQVLFDLLRIGVWRQSESIGFELGQCGMRLWDHPTGMVAPCDDPAGGRVQYRLA